MVKQTPYVIVCALMELPARDFSDPFGNGSGTCPFGKNSDILLQIGNFHRLVRCVY